MTAAGGGGLHEELLAKRPILVESFLGFGAIGDDAFLVAFAADAEDTFFLVEVGVIEAGEFADAKAGGVEEFKEGAVAAEEEGFIRKFGWRARRNVRFRWRYFLRRLAVASGSRAHRGELIQETNHLFGGEDGGDAFGKLGSGNEARGIFLQVAFADAIFEEGAERGEFPSNGAFLEMVVVQVADKFANGIVRDGSESGWL